MAIYECDYGRHRYPQPQQTIYYTHVIGSVMDTYRMRMCPAHFRDSVVLVKDELAPIDDDSQTSVNCERCHGDKAGVLYAKVFPAKEEAMYFGADLCARCLSEVGNQLRIFNGSALTSRLDPSV